MSQVSTENSEIFPEGEETPTQEPVQQTEPTEAPAPQPDPEVEKLRSFRESAAKLIEGGLSPEEWADATRTVLVEMGYDAREVNAFIEEQLSPREEPTVPEPREVPEETPQSGEELDQIRQELMSVRLDTMKRALQESVEAAMRSDDVRTLLTKVESLHGKERAQQVASTLRAEMQENVIKQARIKAETTGAFEPSWFEQEAGKVAKEVAGKYDMVLGDVSKLGRAPASTAEEALVAQEPKKPPTYEPGKTAEDVGAELRDYNVDALTRLLHETKVEL